MNLCHGTLLSLTMILTCTADSAHAQRVCSERLTGFLASQQQPSVQSNQSLVAQPIAAADTTRPAARKKNAGTTGRQVASVGQQPDRVIKNRKFRFDYAFTLHGLEHGTRVRVWLPYPIREDDSLGTDAAQRVTALNHNIPVKVHLNTEPKYGNRILYFEIEAPESGKLDIDVPYRVERREVTTSSAAVRFELRKTLRDRLLLRNERVPITGKPTKLIAFLDLKRDPIALGRQLYDAVDSHVEYKKQGTGWGQGDVLWVCDSKYGNCTDFHSLFISLARSRKLPSLFEIGFPIPVGKKSGSVSGYHCWAWFFPDGRQPVPVDISEADKHPELKDYYFGNLSADRISFSLGRDLDLVPQQSASPLNYFVYPHVEVDGKLLPKNQIKLRFSFQDLMD